MTTDTMAWLVTLVLIVAIILGVLQHYTAAWSIVVIGIVLLAVVWQKARK